LRAAIGPSWLAHFGANRGGDFRRRSRGTTGALRARTMRILYWLGLTAGAVAVVAAGCKTTGTTFDSSTSGDSFFTPTSDNCGDGCEGGPELIHPTFERTVSASVAPPPISGGTLLVTHDGAKAVVADPDRDAV
jgi:hypothetical protein